MNNKICLFLPNLCIGGAERSAVNIANGLDKKGYDIDVVLVKKQGEYVESLNKTINIINLEKNKASQSIIALSRYIKKNNPRAIISFMDHCNVVATLAKKISNTNTKVIATIHSTISQRKKSCTNEIMKIMQQNIYKYLDKIVVVSKEAGEDAEEVLKIPDQKLEIIYNPIITEEMFEKAEEKINHKWIGKEEYFTIIGVGRLTDEKGFDDLIRAFKIVKKSNENVRLVILGEGNNRCNLESIIKELGLEDYIDMPGFVNPYPYMKLANLFVLSSRREGLPSALIESMALGTNVLSTNCKSGPKEILKDGRLGKLVDVGDVYAISGGINEIIKENIKMNYENSLQEFKEENIINQYIDIINIS